MKFAKCLDCAFKDITEDYESFCNLQKCHSHSVEYPDCVFILNDRHTDRRPDRELWFIHQSKFTKKIDELRYNKPLQDRYLKALKMVFLDESIKFPIKAAALGSIKRYENGEV